MDSPLQAPAVVAVVVTCDPGPWFEETLQALAAQDYPNLSILVVDANSVEDPTPRVARVLPDAFVRRLTANRGYAASANEVLQVVDGASHFLLCHDDVVPAPDAVRLMVEEAFRSNAGIVAPKLLDWEEPRRLLQVGMSVDRSGAPIALAERGELDQAQHDNVRDVFYAPGGFTLVRADLFESLDGFDPLMRLYGEDLDLSWRAHIAGARVVVAPAARVRHLEAMSRGHRSPGGGPPPTSVDVLRRRIRPLQLRHRLRAVLKAYGRWHLLRVLPQAVIMTVLEVAAAILFGRGGTARDVVKAWSWNVRHLGQLRSARRQVRRTRRMSDAEIRDLQSRELARFAAFLRAQGLGDRLTAGAVAGRLARASGVDRDRRLPIAVALGAVVLLLVGSRQLIGDGIPALNELAPFPRGVGGFLRPFFSGWREVGLGSEGPAPAAFAVLGLGALALGGAGGLLQTVVVVGALPAGAVGAYRLARPLGSQRACLAALVVYASAPVAFNALAGGRLSGLLAYAAAPWILGRLLRVTGLETFGPGPRGDPRRTFQREVVPLGVLMAVVAAIAPSVVIMAVLAAAGIVAGCLLGGGAMPARRAVLVAAGAGAVATVLLFPWSLTFLRPGAQFSALLGEHDPAGGFSWGALLRFQTGPVGDPPVGWAFVVAAALPLLVGRAWRLAWAARFWGLALTCWAVAWTWARGWLPLPMPAVEVLLAPAAVAIALAVALGMVAFEVDLPGYRFGWRQVASTAALVATLVGVVPVLTTAVGGRWGLPPRGFASQLSWMEEQRRQGPFRVLWLGDPQALPLGAWRLGEGLSYATSRNGPPDATSLWPGGSPGATSVVADAVGVARRRGTTRLGRLLAPMAIRYVVVPSDVAPAGTRSPSLPAPPDLGPALDAQVDLKRLPRSDEALSVYENAAWAPGRSLLNRDDAEASRSSGLVSLASVDLSGSRFALPRQRSAHRFQGRLNAGDVVLLSETFSERWSMRVASRSATQRRAFGWANAFTASSGGSATLRYRTPPARYVALLLQAGLWVLAIRLLLVSRRAP